MTVISPSPQHVAVYGTLRVGQRAERLWSEHGGTYLGTCWMYGWEMRDLGPFPMAVPSDEQSRIKVDVIQVDAAILNMLDRYEGFPHLYDRQRVPLVVGGAVSPRNRLGWVSAWVYTPSADTLDEVGLELVPVVQSGDWTNRFTTSRTM